MTITPTTHHTQNNKLKRQLLTATAIGLGFGMIALVSNLTSATAQPVTYQGIASNDVQFITGQIDRMLEDDRTNPVCEYMIDTEGYSHGCLTDVQLDALDSIITYINE